ncbi:hypothetical protein Gotur_000510, partial [Gossypium turneri]
YPPCLGKLVENLSEDDAENVPRPLKNIIESYLRLLKTQVLILPVHSLMDETPGLGLGHNCRATFHGSCLTANMLTSV